MSGHLIYEKSRPGRRGLRWPKAELPEHIPQNMLRESLPRLPELGEREVVQHFTELSQRNFCVDTHFYPLGSCTMKYNPKAGETAANLAGFARLHPLWAQLPDGETLVQGALRILFEMEQFLCELTGMSAFTFQPLAGAHGELTGALIMAAYHRHRGNRKTHILVPASAHGTNPASAAMAGYRVITVPCEADGAIRTETVRRMVNAETAGIMLTSPSTLGLFVANSREIADLIHAVDGLMYYDGANLNALLGRCKPAHLGFDLCHLNLHKTFATPHGGGGPGAGPVGVVQKLRPFLPPGRVIERPDGALVFEKENSLTIGPVAPFYGHFGVVVRAWLYLRMLGREGLRATSNLAVLNANYVQEKLRPVLEAVAQGRCMHECVFSGRVLQTYGVSVRDLAKALLDYGIHPPTVYFPQSVPDAIMIEPTETETRETLDRFIEVMTRLVHLAQTNPAALQQAPTQTPIGRLDEVVAARNMDVVFPETA